MSPRYVIGIDVGGTFTDVVGIASDGTTTLTKASSTPEDQSIGALNGVGRLAEALGLTVADLLSRTDRLVHGTTVATNALLENNGARAAMLTTEGHRDVIEMREGLKPERYNLRLEQPEQLIPRSRRLGVSERLRDDGRTETALDHASLARAVEAAKAEGVSAVAVCFLHSWNEPRHEREAAAYVAEQMPGAFITCSSDVLPEIKEFERFSTTAVNAYVGPAVSSYLNRLVGRFAEAGLRAPLFVILSNGGVAPVETAAQQAVATALSGPAGGVAAAVAIAGRSGYGDIITFDMGGTSTDIAVISEGRPTLARDRSVGNHRIALESLDIVTIGAGGGSIAEIGPGGTLRVGPRSAGSVPGPAAYGLGGEAPTVTDANLMLGLLDKNAVLGGKQRLDAEASRHVITELAGKLGITPPETAAGIIQLANARMADGIRVATVRRGIDPRDMAMLSFGGAAGLHSADVAREIGIKRVLVPLYAAGLSAWGMLHTDLRYETSRSVHDPELVHRPDDLRALLSGLADQAMARLREWWDGPVETVLRADMRYGDQVFEIDVPLPDPSSPDLAEAAIEAFHARHKALFTYDLRDEPVIIVTARAAAIGKLTVPAVPERDGAATADEQAMRVVDGLISDTPVPVYRMETMAEGFAAAGPAILQSETTSVWVGAGDRFRHIGNDLIEIEIGG